MSGTLINLIIQIIAGVVGGHAAGTTLKNTRLARLATQLPGLSAELSAVNFFSKWYQRWRASTLERSSVRSSAAVLEALS
jgi:hypothetical protein